MALVTKRYMSQGPVIADLKESMDPNLVLVATNYRVYVDVTYDDALCTMMYCSQELARFGFVPDPDNTSGSTPFVGLRSPDGSIWELVVDDAGNLSTVKRTT